MRFLHSLRGTDENGLYVDDPAETLTDKEAILAALSEPDSGVSDLQQALKMYSKKFKDPSVDPGPKATGLVDEPTALATLYVAPRVANQFSSKLPQWLLGLISIGPELAMISETSSLKIRKFIKDNAGKFTAAVMASMVGETIADSPGGGGGGIVPGSGYKRPDSVVIYDKQGRVINLTAGNEAAFTPFIFRLPNGDLAPGLPPPGVPSVTIFTRKWWNGYYRVAGPRPVNLGATYNNYVELTESVSKPAVGTEVDRSTFEAAIGHWWATTPILLGLGTLGLGGAAFGAYRLMQRR